MSQQLPSRGKPWVGKVRDRAVTLTAVVFTAVFLAFAVHGSYESYQHRTIFLALCLVLAFTTNPPRKGENRNLFEIYLDTACVIAAIFAGCYGAFQNYDILLREGSPIESDIWVGCIVMALTLEATRRVAGLALTLIALILLAYVFLGPHMPRIIAHGGYDLTYIVASNYMNDQGLYGVILGVTADFIFLFILFGALLERAGAVQHFNNLSQSLMGKQTGGPAKTAVLASGLMGSVSGSAVANVVTTGTFTIPLMRRLGYPAAFAGGVEAAASTGGQFMPPIMGATAFVIAATLSVPYLEVAKSALVPAVLYFFSVGMSVHFMSKKLGLKGLPAEELPRFLPTFKISAPLFLPLVAIVIVLVQGFSVITAGLAGIAFVMVVSALRKESRLSPRKMFEALENAGKNIIGVGLACATAGIIANAIAISGLGMRISSITVMMGDINLILALVFAMFASLVLGMGMPTVAAYVIVSTLGAPALVDLGMPVMATHLFVFFFAIVCSVTPPVALAAFAAAPLAGLKAGAWRVGIEAFKLAIAAFVVPYFFIFNTHLLLEGDVVGILLSVATAMLGVVALSAAAMGYFISDCSVVARVLLIATALGLLYHDIFVNLVSAAAMAALYMMQRRQLPR